MTDEVTPVIIDTTSWHGGIRHRADANTMHWTDTTQRVEHVSLCGSTVLAQGAYSDTRRAANLPSQRITDMVLCQTCRDIEHGMTQPPKSPEDFLDGVRWP